MLLLASLLASAATFTHGVASGDVTSSSAVVWTRVDGEAELTVEVSKDPSFRTIALQRNAVATGATDFTVKVVIEPLDPSQTYFYRWTDGNSVSEVGTFRTAPPRNVSANVRFAWSGDSDAGFNQFEALDAARREGLDFFVYLGDTIYADSELRPAPARTLDQYREAYKVNREFPALRDLLKSTSTYAIWDDHEVRNDFDAQTVDRRLYANGRQAFLEYLPILNLQFPDRNACVADPLFRFFHWGRNVDIIILDERSCRSAEAVAACTVPDSPFPDLAPALPAGFRIAVGLPPEPPRGCLDAIFDPSRTMLGSFQKLVFKAALLYSKTRFKFVINEVAIQQFFAWPYDRWEGYGAERTEILNFIRENNISNVIFLTTDLHANLINKVIIDRFRDPAPIADEFVTGPIATRTLQRELQDINPLAPVALTGILSLLGLECWNLNAFSYGLVEVNSTATITLKDDHGTVLCSKTLP